MKLVGGDWLLALGTEERDEIDEALAFAILVLDWDIEGATKGEDRRRHRLASKTLAKLRRVLADE